MTLYMLLSNITFIYNLILYNKKMLENVTKYYDTCVHRRTINIGLSSDMFSAFFIDPHVSSDKVHFFVIRSSAMCRGQINSSAPLFEFCRSTWRNLWLCSRWQENKRGREYNTRAILCAIGQKRVSWDTDRKVQPRLDWRWNFVLCRRVRIHVCTWIRYGDGLSGKERENVMYAIRVLRSTDLFDAIQSGQCLRFSCSVLFPFRTQKRSNNADGINHR